MATYVSLVYKARLLAFIIYDLIIALLGFPLLFVPKALSSVIRSQKGTETRPKTYKSRAQHDREVARVAREVATAFSSHKQIVLYRKPGHGHSARSAEYKLGHHAVDIVSLSSILHVDVLEKTIDVQAGITFENLCRETLTYGLLPLVVPEFKSITVGGAIQGIGIESSSWCNGALDETVVRASLILGDGTIVSSEDVPELWKDVPGSNGSLALVVAATLRLAPASELMAVQYRLFNTLDEFKTNVNRLITRSEARLWQWKGSQRLVDAVLVRDLGIVAMFAGCITPEQIQSMDVTEYTETPFSPFFFQHIHTVAQRLDSLQRAGQENEHGYLEYMPTMQYLFRFDRGGVSKSCRNTRLSCLGNECRAVEEGRVGFRYRIDHTS